MTKFVPYAYAGGPKIGSAAMLAVGIANWAAKENCDWDPDKEGPGEDPLAATGCMKADGPYITIFTCFSSQGCFAYHQGVIEIEYMRFVPYTTENGNPAWRFERKFRDSRGWQELVNTTNPASGVPTKLEGRIQQGMKCEKSFPFTPIPPDPYEYTTEEGCTLNVSFKSLVQGNDGNVGGLWQIEPAAETRAAGGVIRGCFFNPTMYYDGGGSGEPPRVYPIPIPEPPGDDWWKDLLKAALGAAAGNLLAAAVKEALNPPLPKAEFLFVAPCDKDAEGKPLEVLYEFPAQKYQSRVVSQQAVIMEILQQHLNWKTPICSCDEGKGDYRTISFISDESSPDGDGRLRKRFRYRSQSGLELDAIVDYWKDFTFNAGPVCVQHRGSALGSPQVWAASANEGKRVIQHAAREAGIDPNQVGEWSVGGSDNPRYGMPGTMRVNTKGGYYWITSRLGENNRPLVVPT